MNRQLIIQAPDVTGINEILINNEYNMSERNLIPYVIKSSLYEVMLIGYDGTPKASYNKFNQKVMDDIFKKIDKMPMRVFDSQFSKEISMIYRQSYWS